MHYAVHRHTAAELIYERADADKSYMGLTTWAATPEGKIAKRDVSVAKNYLSEQEMRSLERIVSAYLDLAENRAERHITMTDINLDLSSQIGYVSGCIRCQRLWH